MTKSDTPNLPKRKGRGPGLRFKGRQGIGFFIPEGLAMSEWQNLKQEWDNRLLASGHDEIEQFATDHTGYFTPFFVKTKHNKSIWGSSGSALRQYDSATAEYYRRVGLFLHHANLNSRKLFRDKVRIYRYLLCHMAEGATLQSIIDKLATEAPPSIRMKRSIFWIHARVHEIKDKMNGWWVENEGLEDY